MFTYLRSVTTLNVEHDEIDFLAHSPYNEWAGPSIFSIALRLQMAAHFHEVHGPQIDWYEDGAKPDADAFSALLNNYVAERRLLPAEASAILEAAYFGAATKDRVQQLHKAWASPSFQSAAGLQPMITFLQTTQLCTVYPNDDVSTSIWQGIQKTKDASGLTLLPLLRMLGVSEMSMSM